VRPHPYHPAPMSPSPALSQRDDLRNVAIIAAGINRASISGGPWPAPLHRAHLASGEAVRIGA